MSLEFLKSYLKHISIMEDNISNATIKDKKDWLNRVKNERIKTEAEIAVLAAEHRAWGAENALKSLIAFMFKRKTQHSKDRIEQTLIERHGSTGDSELY